MHFSTGVYSECTSVIKRTENNNKNNNVSGIIHGECDCGRCADSTSNNDNNGEGNYCNNNKAIIIIKRGLDFCTNHDVDHLKSFAQG